MRTAQDGVSLEPSPYTSIPGACWWFIVTATTTGYGDQVPTSSFGKIVASAAMLLSLLVLAFPISVFTNLWKEEFDAKHNRRDSDVASTVFSEAESERDIGASEHRGVSLPVGGGGARGESERERDRDDQLEAIREEMEKIREAQNNIEVLLGQVAKLTPATKQPPTSNR
jgi:hypothetical protein